jgi:hypothetical protein
VVAFIEPALSAGTSRPEIGIDDDANAIADIPVSVVSSDSVLRAGLHALLAASHRVRLVDADSPFASVEVGAYGREDALDPVPHPGVGHRPAFHREGPPRPTPPATPTRNAAKVG